ncbi:MAG: DUF2949 domain-containing protein [Spirulinaceae cyanobacterium RM2_2_10]|nr:DUF2949 domain-containing protein [Spirulinaceae cyanobacterium SM2_1_0]NJO19520.1 DUF2949 domain-containing protein [Spirulinaceae cyanobacterium RM2_2_10]
MTSLIAKRFLQFLHDELAIPADSLAVALRSPEAWSLHQLPIVLWQYGLVTIEQLDSMLEWLETA